MNHHDDQLRQLLSELADDAPLALGRKEAVMSRVSRRMQRQMAVRGVAALAVAIGLGLGAAGTVQQIQNAGSDSHHDETTLATEPTHEPSHEGTPPPVTTEPTHAPTTVAPTPPATHEPSHEPTRATVGDPTTKPAAERRGARGPLRASAAMDPSTIAAGSTATAVVTARDGAGRLLAVDIDWGDGSSPFHFSPGDAACPRTTHLDGRFTHTYSTARSTPYPVRVTITSGDCAATEKKTVETHVTVTGAEPSPTETNGPSQPTGSGSGPTNGDNPQYVYLHVVGSDDDGFVRRMVVTWGDGSTTLVGEWSTSGCTDAAGTTHPTSSTREATRDYQGNSLSHHYSTAGEHTVTVEVDSVACDGTDQQVANSTFAVTQTA